MSFLEQLKVELKDQEYDNELLNEMLKDISSEEDEEEEEIKEEEIKEEEIKKEEIKKEVPEESEESEESDQEKKEEVKNIINKNINENKNVNEDIFVGKKTIPKVEHKTTEEYIKMSQYELDQFANAVITKYKDYEKRVELYEKKRIQRIEKEIQDERDKNNFVRKIKNKNIDNIFNTRRRKW